MSTVTKTRKLVGTAMLAAVSVVLMFLAFPVPLMPSFIKLDLAELPALIGAFAYGPLAGAAVCLVKNLVSLMKSASGGIGTRMRVCLPKAEAPADDATAQAG